MSTNILEEFIHIFQTTIYMTIINYNNFVVTTLSIGFYSKFVIMSIWFSWNLHVNSCFELYLISFFIIQRSWRWLFESAKLMFFLHYSTIMNMNIWVGRTYACVLNYNCVILSILSLLFKICNSFKRDIISHSYQSRKKAKKRD